MKNRISSDAAPGHPIGKAGRFTGLFRDHPRRGVKNGRLPYILGNGGNAAESGCFVRPIQHRAGENLKTARTLRGVLDWTRDQLRKEGFQ